MTRPIQNGPVTPSERGLFLPSPSLLLQRLIIIFGWLPRHRNDEKIEREARERVEEKPRVDAYVVKRAPSVSELMVPGTALAYTEAYIYARASGYLTQAFRRYRGPCAKRTGAGHD